VWLVVERQTNLFGVFAEALHHCLARGEADLVAVEGGDGCGSWKRRGFDGRSGDGAGFDGSPIADGPSRFATALGTRQRPYVDPHLQ
jgi:hypothetical protein